MKQLTFYLTATIVLLVVAFTIGSLLGYSQGYRAALKDYVSGNIDCIIRVQHPDLLERK